MLFRCYIRPNPITLSRSQTWFLSDLAFDKFVLVFDQLATFFGSKAGRSETRSVTWVAEWNLAYTHIDTTDAGGSLRTIRTDENAADLRSAVEPTDESRLEGSRCC